MNFNLATGLGQPSTAADVALSFHPLLDDTPVCSFSFSKKAKYTILFHWPLDCIPPRLTICCHICKESQWVQLRNLTGWNTASQILEQPTSQSSPHATVSAFHKARVYYWHTFYLFLFFRDRGRGEERKINVRNVTWMPPVRTPMGELNLQPFGARDDAPTNWATRPGLYTICLGFFF